jgi:hypothetical protein
VDKEEAKRILHSELKKLQSKRYDKLLDMIDSQKTYKITAPSGSEYQIEVQAFWDNPSEPGGDLRVIASIDDGGFISSLMPLSMDFIISPSGD